MTSFELILVNDGSTDDTEKIIQKFSDERIRYIYQANKGQAAACNKGLLESKGNFIKFFDADDVMNTEHLEAQLATIETDSTAISSCVWGRFYTHDPYSAVFQERDLNKEENPLNWLKHSLSQRYDMMPGWLWLIPKEVLMRAGGWDEELSLNNDFEFSIRVLLHASSVRLAPKAKLYYRSSQNNSLSAKKTMQSYQSAFLSAKKGCSYLLKRENSKDMKRLCANKYLFWMYEMYPKYAAIIEAMETEVEKLGGGDRKIGGQSRPMHFLQSIVGWKFAKRIWLFFR